MKKITVSLVLVVILLGGSIAQAQSIPQSQTLTEQYRYLLLTLIKLLTQQVQDLQAQLAEVKAREATPSAPVTYFKAVEPLPTLTPPVSVPTSLPSPVSASVSIRYGEIKRLLSGGFVVVDDKGNTLFQSNSSESDEAAQWYKDNNIQPIPYKPPKQCRYEGTTHVCN